MMKLEIDLDVPETTELALLLSEIRYLADIMSKANINRQQIWDRSEFDDYVNPQIKQEMKDCAMSISHKVEQLRGFLQEDMLLPVVDSLLAIYETVSGNALVNRPTTN